MVPDMDSNAWDDRYRGSDLLWGEGPNRFLVEEVAGLRPGSALDVACGEGRNAIWLAEQGWEVVGVDFSALALEKARRMAEQRKVDVQWVQADLTAWTPERSFDLVVVMYLHLPAQQRHRLLSRLASRVAAGGTMLVVGHDLSNLTEGHGGPQDPSILYGPQEVIADIGADLQIERAEQPRRTVGSGPDEATAIDVLVRARRP